MLAPMVTSAPGHPRGLDVNTDHLWMHFTPPDESVTTIARGEGCYVWDTAGNRYLDGLAGLFCVQVGHGRAEIAEAMSTQAASLAYFPIWSYAHGPAVELAGRLAERAPAGLNRVFFTTSGSDAVESAWKLARQYHRLRGDPGRYKVISRHLSYHGTSFGALAVSGLPAYKSPFEPMLPGSVRVQQTDRYRCLDCAQLPACSLRCAEDIRMRIEMEGPETVAAVFLEPVQNAGGAFTPPEGYWARVREICDEYGVLLVSDEVICAFGRLGEWFGCQRYGYVPDLITFAKGVTSGYAPLGGVMISDRVAEPFVADKSAFMHGFTFGGHPVSCASALANIDIFEREDVLGRVRRHGSDFRAVVDGLRDLPIVGDVRGDGYFYAIELVTDRETKGQFTADQANWLLRGVLSPRLFELGLVCRTDDRGEPVVVLSPPLVAGPEEFAMIGSVLRQALTEAWTALQSHR